MQREWVCWLGNMNRMLLPWGWLYSTGGSGSTCYHALSVKCYAVCFASEGFLLKGKGVCSWEQNCHCSLVLEFNPYGDVHKVTCDIISIRVIASLLAWLHPSAVLKKRAVQVSYTYHISGNVPYRFTNAVMQCCSASRLHDGHYYSIPCPASPVRQDSDLALPWTHGRML